MCPQTTNKTDVDHIFSRGFPRSLIEVEISGVSEAFANLTDLGALDPVVKATITLSESGFVSVSKAIAFGEIKDDSIAGEFSTSYVRETSLNVLQQAKSKASSVLDRIQMKK
jgi:hypoxia up-regulated 1